MSVSLHLYRLYTSGQSWTWVDRTRQTRRSDTDLDSFDHLDFIVVYKIIISVSSFF